MNLSDILKQAGVKSAQEMRDAPVWDGPESYKSNGGITFSLLSRWLVCKERFRCLVVEGLKPMDGFQHRIEYGNMWHLCEEHYQQEGLITAPTNMPNDYVNSRLKDYCIELCKRYPLAQDEIDKWYNVCRIQFPLYIKYWREREKTDNSASLLREKTFRVGYNLPSGRTVYLRGKWDEVLLRQGGVYLKENKTKGDIDPVAIPQQLKFDLQTMIYLCALDADREEIGNALDSAGLWYNGWDYGGVIYNVVRRPLSGGRGNITQKKGSKNVPAESKADYYKRLGRIIDGTDSEDAPGPDYFFMRWKVDISRRDIDRFRQRTLNPILEQLCCWWDGVSGSQYLRNIPNECLHYQMPYGVWNPLAEGRGTDYDNYLMHGDLTGLVKTTELFPELNTHA